MISKPVRAAIALGVLGGVIGGFPRLTAQSPAGLRPQRVSVTITQVIPEQADAFRALVRDEGIPAERKSALQWRATYNEVFGDLHSFITVRPVTNLSDFDQPSAFSRVMGQAAAARYAAKQRAMVMSQRRIVLTEMPELSIRSGSMMPANLIMHSERKLLPGRQQDYAQLVTSQVLPAFRKAGIRDEWHYQVSYGTYIHRVIVRPIASIGELDVAPGQGALARGAGAETAQKLTQQLQSMTDWVENKVYRLVPDLSYGPEPVKPVK